jgi:phosphocarrier protein
MNSGDRPSGKNEAKTVRRKVTIINSRGLHARAAAQFAKAAGGFKAKILVSKGDQSVSGLSIMGLMMLAASPGSDLELVASGPDAKAAIDALETLIAAKFEEDDPGNGAGT